MNILRASSRDVYDLAALEIRSFAADDTSQIARLMHPREKQPPYKEQIERRAASISESLRHHLIKATSPEGKIVGYATWVSPGQDRVDITTPNGPAFADRFKARVNETRKEKMGQRQYWYLAMLVVDPDYWRQGVGRTLVQWGLHLADASGTSTCFLEASVMAEAFYTKLGFRTLGWDQVQTDVASHDFCRWPYMIRE